VTIVAIYGFYQFTIQDYGALFWLVNPRLDTSLAHGRFTFWPWRDRITSVLTSEMELGHFLNLCLPLTAVLSVLGGFKKINFKWIVCASAVAVALLLTFTFGAWLALLATLSVYVALFEKKWRGRVLKAVLSSILILGLVVAFTPLHVYIESKLFGTAAGSLAWDVFTRVDAWLFALRTWWSHPLIGVGVGNYEILEYAHEFIHSQWGPSGSTPHETYLYLLAELGIVGFVPVVVILLRTIRWDISLRRDSRFGLIALGIAFALTANMIGWFGDDSTFFGPHTSYLVWLLVGISESIHNISNSPAQEFA
jgi:O-antigen ligase